MSAVLRYFIGPNPAESFIKQLDQIEMRRLLLPASTEYLDILSQGEEILHEEGLLPLKRRLIALKYRIEKGEKGPGEELVDKGDNWKRQQKLLWNKGLTELEKDALYKASTYREFLPLLNNPEVFESFMHWVVRDHLPHQIFIEYPYIVDLINSHLLNGRIGTVSGNHLKIQRLGSYKTVTLPFEGKETEILDLEKVIHLRGGLSLTIKEIFGMFRDKPKKFVDVEYFAQGVMNWNAQHMGYYIAEKNAYEAIDIYTSEWWKQLPPLEILTKEESQSRYGDYINGNNWAIGVKASREYLNLSYEKCHAYLEIAIPNRDHSYNIYEFGKFSRIFPYGVFESLTMFTLTTPATIAYPDENIYHTARQQVGYSFGMNHFQGLILMDELKQDIIEGRTGNMVFQVETENCGKWIQTHVEDVLGKENVPNLFRVHLLQSDAKGFVGAIFKFLRMLPDSLQAPILTSLHFPFGAWKGQFVTDRYGNKEYKALTRSSFWQDIYVYLPALLHRLYEQNNKP
jgi:hypothetical protein